MQFNKKDNERILNKLVELKNVFLLGEKIVPMIQSLTTFMEEIVPLLNNVNLSINESNQKMPIAKNQIENVTAATELATTEILDTIDASGQILEDIANVCIKLGEVSNSSTGKYKKLEEMLAGNEDALSLVKEIQKENSITENVESLNEKVNDLNDKNFQMTMSLQVQDITSQQLAAVNHLINQVQDKLELLIDDIDNSHISNQINDIKANGSEKIDDKELDFNSEASFAHDDRQNKADEIVDEHNSNERASQDEIDKLFGNL
ncbi:MAG: hypothetical protein ACEPO8_09820 [Rhodothermaceae bacterium]